MIDPNNKPKLTESSVEKIATSKFIRDEFLEAMRVLAEENGVLPHDTVIDFLARMYAACRLHDDVRQEIGDKIKDQTWLAEAAFANALHQPEW